MEGNSERAGAFLAEIMDTLEDEIGKSGVVGEILVVMELAVPESKERETEAATILRVACTDHRSFVQKGILTDALDGLREDTSRIDQ